LSKRTINQHIQRMGTLLRWAMAESEGKMVRNPAQGLGVGDGRTHTREDRHPFSTTQLSKIFHAPLYTGCLNDGAGYATPGPNRPKGTRFWVPLIGLFQGMRLNEICQLKIADIERIDGVLCIRVQEGDEDQRVKTSASRRVVPVHPRLLALGFADYVAARGAPNAWLFPDLKADSRGYRSDGFQKWFRRFQDKVGTYTPKTTFHSFRHNWRDAARNARIPEEITEALGGWTRQKVSSNYGSGASPKVLFEEISKIEFPGVDLSHLQ
jgi:integrase